MSDIKMTNDMQTANTTFRKRPVVINAVQYAEYGKMVKGMCNSVSCYKAGNDRPHVHTSHDDQLVNLEVGDWIIPEPDGQHFYPCKPDIFAATYELVSQPANVMTSREFWKTLPHCVSYPECDGDLEGTEHSDKCPLYGIRELTRIEFAGLYAEYYHKAMNQRGGVVRS
jgi:hypothetical protein